MTTTAIVLILALLALLIYAGGEKLYQLHVERQTVGTVTVTITADTSEFDAAMRRAARDLGDMKAKVGAHFAPAIRDLADVIVTFSRRMEVWQAGAEAKWFTRGALYASLGWPDECVNEEVQRALTEEFLFPTQAAAAFLRGWVEYRPNPAADEIARLRALPLDPHPMYDELVAP